jgi:hypothetical protein
MPRRLPLTGIDRSRQVVLHRGGPAPLLEFSLTAPYWTYSEPTYDDAVRLDDQNYPAILPDLPWLVWYPADALPEASDPAWNESLAGGVTRSVADSVLTIVDTIADAGWLYYVYDLPALSNTLGTVFEARLKVTADAADENQGAVLSLLDGAYQFAAWLRHDGLNIDGEVDVPADLTYFRQIRLEVQGQYAHLWLDGVEQQAAGFMNPTSEKKIIFGTWMGV